jgi:hypothetical protein
VSAPARGKDAVGTGGVRGGPLHPPAPSQVVDIWHVSGAEHAVPWGLGDHAVWLTLGRHDWHSFVEFTSPLATHIPKISQLPEVTTHVFIASLHTRQESKHGDAVPPTHVPPLHWSPTVQ